MVVLIMVVMAIMMMMMVMIVTMMMLMMVTMMMLVMVTMMVLVISQKRWMKECRRDNVPLGGDKYIQTHLYPTPRGNWWWWFNGANTVNQLENLLKRAGNGSLFWVFPPEIHPFWRAKAKRRDFYWKKQKAAALVQYFAPVCCWLVPSFFATQTFRGFYWPTFFLFWDKIANIVLYEYVLGPFFLQWNFPNKSELERHGAYYLPPGGPAQTIGSPRGLQPKPPLTTFEKVFVEKASLKARLIRWRTKRAQWTKRWNFQQPIWGADHPRAAAAPSKDSSAAKNPTR